MHVNTDISLWGRSTKRRLRAGIPVKLALNKLKWKDRSPKPSRATQGDLSQNKTVSWRINSAIKSTGWSFRGPKFGGLHPHHADHNSLKLQIQGNQRPLWRT